MKLLEIKSSVCLEKSISRALSHEFIEVLQNLHPDLQHQQQDVGTNPPAHPTELWTTANYLPPESRTPEMATILTESDRLIMDEEIRQQEVVSARLKLMNLAASW